MPIQYVLMDQGALVYARAHGTVTVTELVEHEKNVLGDSNVQSGYKQLLDCRWVKDDLVDQSVVPALAEVHSQHMPQLNGSRYAIVTHNPQWFQVGSQYECDRYSMTMIVFNDPSTECIWLGVDYRDLAQGGGLDAAEDVPKEPWTAAAMVS